MQALIEKDTGNPKDIAGPRSCAEAKPIYYYLRRNKDRDVDVGEAVTKGQQSMTDVGKALGLTVLRITRLVNVENEDMARGEAWPNTVRLSADSHFVRSGSPVKAPQCMTSHSTSPRQRL